MTNQKLFGNALVVDDEEDIRTILTFSLKSFGLNVDVACNGEIGLEMIGKKDYDYIITDLTMPVMDGREFIKRCKEVSSYNSKIFVITGYSTDEIEDLLVDGILEKPFRKREIFSQLVGSPAI